MCHNFTDEASRWLGAVGLVVSRLPTAIADNICIFSSTHIITLGGRLPCFAQILPFLLLIVSRGLIDFLILARVLLLLSRALNPLLPKILIQLPTKLMLTSKLPIRLP